MDVLSVSDFMTLTNNCTILGSGFGLYGYLPAAVESFDCTVVLPERSRIIFGRPEQYKSSILWTRDVTSALEQSKTLVIAVPPSSQPDLVIKSMMYSNIRSIILEKPVAVCPQISRQVIELILSSGRNCRIGYTLQTDWCQHLLASAAHDSKYSINIDWSFMAHHFANRIDTWKKQHDCGGVLRFFGIHLIALLALLGYSDVIYSSIRGQKSGEPEYCYFSR